MKTVIITGAAGFIGSNLAKHFEAKGYNVYRLVHSSENKTDSHVIEFDMSCVSDVADRLPENADIFYHLAWEGVDSAVKDDYTVQSRNIGYCLDVLRLAEKLHCKKIVYVGSVSEYAYSNAAVDGNSAPSPSDMYGACKVAAHYICDLYARKNNLDFIWTLVSSIYGPGRNDSNILTYAIKTFLAGGKPSFTKLEQKWDYVYIDDLLEGLFLAGIKGRGGSVYAIGSGIAYSLAQYIEIIRDAINPGLPMGVGELPYKTASIDNSIVDISLLREHTGYEPKVGFEEGIKNMIDYYKRA